MKSLLMTCGALIQHALRDSRNMSSESELTKSIAFMSCVRKPNPQDMYKAIMGIRTM